MGKREINLRYIERINNRCPTCDKLILPKAKTCKNHKPKTTNKKISGERHYCWKGDRAKYGAIHDWIRYNYGSPRICRVCGTTNSKKYEWANIDHKYKRDINDYIRMCSSCHKKHDFYNLRQEVELKCIVCNKLFKTKSAQSKYCSHECYLKLIRINKKNKNGRNKHN